METLLWSNALAAIRSLSYPAAATVSGLAMKLQDNSDDEHGWRKDLPKFASTLLSPSIDKATAILNTSEFPTQKVIETLDQQSTIEKTKAGFMEASEPTAQSYGCLLYTSPSPRDQRGSRMPSSA